MRRLIKTLIVLLILGGVGYAIYHRVMGETPVGGMPPGGMPPPQAGVATVVARDVRLWNEFSGRLSAVESADIRPRVTGTIEAIHFQDGAIVNKGDLLFTIDSQPFVAALNRAQGALASAEARAKLAKTESQRAEKLVKEKAISPRDYDQRRNDMTVSSADVKSAQAALEEAQLNLAYTQIKAPISGRIGRAEVTVGNLVEAGMGAAPLLTSIVSSTPIYADFEIDEATFLRSVGSASGDVTKLPAKLRLATTGGATYTGHVASFDNRLNPESGTIRGRAVFDNPDGVLVPGLFARILLGSAEPTKALLINDRAVGTDQNKKFVLVVGDGNVTAYREVRLGAMTNGLRIVENGLKEGEKIVVSGLLPTTRPGMPVTPQEVPMDAPDAPPAPVKQ